MTGRAHTASDGSVDLDSGGDVRRVVAVHGGRERDLHGVVGPLEGSTEAVPLVVLVPVLNRPQNVVPLVESFLDTTPGRLCFVGQYDDSDAEKVAVHDACVAYEQVTAIWSSARTWPEKINLAYRTVRMAADWVLFGADDVTFHDGWFEQTAALRAQPEISVIGTNDLGNPRVLSGDHAVHPLVRSSYIGTVDDPDAIVHTGYHHWCVDDEFIITAKIRGVWAPCLTAVVEHNHPYWQKGKWDATYAKGESRAVEDQKLWQSRIPLLQQYADQVMA